jgi:surface protein
VEVSASRPGLSSVGVSVPLSQSGYNSIYAIGKCTNGGTTERSNGLSVFYVASSGPAPRVEDSVLFSLRYNGLSAASFNQADKSLVCTNILQVQPGGVCQILSVLPGSAVVTGTVMNTTRKAATNLVQKLDSGSASSTLLQGTWNSGTPTGVVTEFAETNPVPPVPMVPDPPTDVAMTAYNGDCPTAALDVTFTPPSDSSGMLAYTATCRPTGPYSTTPSLLTATVVKPGSSTTSIRVTPLSRVTGYNCDVQSMTVDKVSSVATSLNAVSTGCGAGPVAPPSPPPLPDFYLASNGVTIRCPNAAIGQSGTVGTTTYTKRDRKSLRTLISDQNWSDVVSTCTTGITDMYTMFSDAAFNGDISTWDVSSVTNMEFMFKDAARGVKNPARRGRTSMIWSVNYVSTL